MDLRNIIESLINSQGNIQNTDQKPPENVVLSSEGSGASAQEDQTANKEKEVEIIEPEDITTDVTEVKEETGEENGNSEVIEISEEDIIIEKVEDENNEEGIPVEPIEEKIKEDELINENNEINTADIGVMSTYGGYAEMFETVDGKEIEPGYFVTLEENKIRKIHANDTFVLGVTTVSPAVLANSGGLRWKNKYLTDEWGRVQYKQVVVPAVTDDEGNVVVPEHKEKRPKLNPNWDSTKKYIPRFKRTEWAAVTIYGQVVVRDDGTSKPGGFCSSNYQGIATAWYNGFRVIERLGPNQIVILIK